MWQRLGGFIPRRRTFLLTGIVLIGGLGLAGAWRLWRASTPDRGGETERLVSGARSALRRGEYRLAEDLASQVPRDAAVWADAQYLAGEAASRAGRRQVAIEYYGRIPRDGSNVSITSTFAFGEACREEGRLSDAEQAYDYVLRNKPGDPTVLQRLVFILDVSGRRWESQVHLMDLLRSGNWTISTLMLLGNPEHSAELDDFLRQSAEHAPDDVLVNLGLAAQAVASRRVTEARQRLQGVVAQAPNLVAAQALLGELLVDTDDAAFTAWHSALPAIADEYPEIWFVRGLGARRDGDLLAAARCFWETVRRSPTHQRGNYVLGQVLVLLGNPAGREFAERSAKLVDLAQALDNVRRPEGLHEATMRRVAQLLEETGRAWEAWGWAAMAAQEFPLVAWPQNMMNRLRPQLHPDTPRTLASANLALKFDLSALSDLRNVVAPAKHELSRGPQATARSTIRFVDQAVSAGIDFVYFNGLDETTSGARMFEQTGGGVAVLDFDGDCRPDLYFPQGADWPRGAPGPKSSGQRIDRLYRNIDRTTFRDVTRASYLGDTAFGQGVAAGDFDNDGFPDLYVANIGVNRLYRNNGDGTFSDVTAESGIEGTTWTASCMIVDLNADGCPDLFDVTYLTGPDVYDRICDGHACSPTLFDGAVDRLFINLGDGRFERAEDDFPTANSKGLGAVAVDLDVRGRPCLFIANDQVANFLLRNEPSDNRCRVHFTDESILCGLAYNGYGIPTACMGIAADDVDADGRIDFFVTNFQDQSNTLYLQEATGVFVDATAAAGLDVPSIPFVGWGTQFLDADLDGDADIVVTNGHVDDYGAAAGDYQMRPQVFENTGGACFVELSADTAGDYFRRKYLGRGLARLDWNRDGRMDFVVSNIGDRVSLVTNASIAVGHYLNVRLRASQSARDAIGAVVSVITERQRWSKQLVAGDGYMASNERILQFGLGDVRSVMELRVDWPSGGTTVLPNPPLDVTLELVEGALQGALNDPHK